MHNKVFAVAMMVFTLPLISLMASMHTRVADIGTSVNGQLTRAYVQTEMHELRSFDETVVTGATVLSAIKNYDCLYTYDMIIYVDGVAYGAAAGANPYTHAVSNISPTDSYSAKLVCNANGVTTGIEFEKTN